jgi:DNA-binding beta-propeller fold protein YncE
LLAFAVTGCASARPTWDLTPRGPVWPAPPETPRVQYLNELRGTEGFTASSRFGSSFREALFGPAAPVQLVTPHAVSAHPTKPVVAVADSNAGRVLVFDWAKHEVTILESTPGANEPPGAPVGVAWLGESLVIADAKHHCLIVAAADGSRWSFGGDQLRRPSSVAVGPAGDRIYVSDAAAHAVFAFAPSGELLFRAGSRGNASGEFNFPSQIAANHDGTLMVADSLNFRVQRLTPEGAPVSAIGRKGDAAGDFALPKGVAVDADGNIWVVDAQFENIQAFTPEGSLLLDMGGEGQGPGRFWLPAGIDIDRENRMWVADAYNRRVQVFQILR